MNMTDLFSLDGRVALVTGGSRGIGRWIAQGFLAAGCERVYITARKAEVVEATAHELGERCVALAGDLATADGIAGLGEALAAREQRLDILVNNAGAAWGAPFHAFPEHGWDKVVDTNLKAPFFLTQRLHPLLAAAGAGTRPAKVINIASVDGLRLNPWETYSYHASKAGLIHLTRRLAARLIADRIVVSCLCPGAFPSEMNKAARDDAAALSRSIPAGRVGEAADIASAAVYLASRAGDYVVGSALAVDGGLVNAVLPGEGPDAPG